MLKDKMNKFKSVILKKDTKENGNVKDKKKIENLVFFLIVLIVTLIAINAILKKDNNNQDSNISLYKELATSNQTQNNVTQDDLEKKIENILTTMAGVRKSKCAYYIFKIK